MAESFENSQRSELTRLAYRSRRARQLVRTGIWQEITDALAAKQAGIAAQALWNGQKSTDETALRSAFQSGRHAEIEELVKMMEQWIRDGQEAEKKLKELGIQI